MGLSRRLRAQATAKPQSLLKEAGRCDLLSFPGVNAWARENGLHKSTKVPNRFPEIHLELSLS